MFFLFVDDLALDVSASSAREVVEAISDASHDLAFALEKLSKLPIAKSKTAVLANTCSTVVAIRANLGPLGGPKIGSVRSLGVDFSAGNAKRASARPVRAVRRSQFLKKLGRLKALRVAERSTASKVFFCGASPGLFFDTPLFGLFGHGLNKARRTAGVFLGLSGCRTSINIALAFAPDKDPEIVHSAPVIRRYCAEVWNASLPPSFRDPAGISLGNLARGMSGHLAAHANPPFLFRKAVERPYGGASPHPV